MIRPALIVVGIAGLLALGLQLNPNLAAQVMLNQRASGRWWTRSLNTDEWHFITYSGTCYALLALAASDRLPPRR